MSAAALQLVDKLTDVTPTAKAVLYCLANAHCDKTRAAWPSNCTIATKVGVQVRTVQRILKQLAAQGVIWRDQRFVAGRQTSNYWRFTAIDGKPSKAASKRNEKLVARGRYAHAQRKSTVSTVVHRGGCHPCHPGGDTHDVPRVTPVSPSGVTWVSHRSTNKNVKLKDNLEPVVTAGGGPDVENLKPETADSELAAALREEIKRAQRELDRQRMVKLATTGGRRRGSDGLAPADFAGLLGRLASA